MPVLPNLRDYDALVREFRWRVPDRYNIGVDVCDRWAARDPGRLAILHLSGDRAEEISYDALREASNRLANALRAQGVSRGDRVAILLPQAPQVAVAHIAIYKLAAVALPLAVLFGVDALSYRLQNSGAKAIITNAHGVARLAEIRAELPDLQLVVSVDGAGDGALGWQTLLDAASPALTPEDTSADDPAMMVYTSGTTGPPKGALHGHRVLLGHLPGIEMSQEFLPQPGDRIWTPADWAWAGGLLNVLLPGLHYGVPVVARRFERFDPEEGYAVMARAQVRNAFIPPTALRMLRSVTGATRTLPLRTLASAGEALGAETYEWAKSTFGLTINEFYGQTECNYVLSACGAIGVSRAGAIGKPVPGHDVTVIRADGTRAEPGELGQIAIRRPDPVMFLGYWHNEAATAAKFLGDWMTTGDQGVTDQDGYVTFIGRDDDVITSSGYRIGPGEIEDCLIKHPAVALAAAVGKPDPLRTEIVKAFIVLRKDHAPSEALAADIQNFVRTRLSAHEYPREVAFIAEMPMTTTGKVIRRLLRDQA